MANILSTLDSVRPPEKPMLTHWNRARTEVSARWRFCVRMTVAAVLAFALSQLLHIPLQGLWAVLTAVVVTQASVGASVRASAEYVVGTLSGAVYASAVGVLIPHTTMIALAGVLALAVAPLALAAALSPSFRVAPFTAVIVLLISNELEGPIEAALYRLFEVAIGGASAVVVSLLVFPERAHPRSLDAAARILDQLAQVLPELLAGFIRSLDAAEIPHLQNEVGQAVAGFQAIATEAYHERLGYFVPTPDPGPLSRTLLRLRHDLVIIGRAAVAPLPETFVSSLGPPLARVGESACDYLRASAAALASRLSPPPLAAFEAALADYASAMSALRSEGATRALSNTELERVFALGFALEQLHRNFYDLERCVREWTAPAARDRSSSASCASGGKWSQDSQSRRAQSTQG
jgi:uncharacterized membrane protein YccC